MSQGYRQIELLIGPFKEGRLLDENGSPKKSRTLSILSNGNIDTMRVQANINKSRLPMSNSANIKIYNLSRNTIDVLQNGGLNVQVLAGYENGNMELLFSGGIGYVKTERCGPDVITTLICREGSYNMLRDAVSISYTNGTPVETVVKDLAQKIPGITVDPTKIKLKGKIGYAGFSYVGSINEAIDKLAYQYGFTWEIDSGMFVIGMDDERPQLKVRLDENSGLKQVSPQLFGPMLIQTGLDIESRYVQGIRPGYSVSVHSKYKDFGDNFVHSISYNLCPKNDQWDMNISTLVFFGSDFS